MTSSDCPQCSPTVTLDLSQGQRVLEHIGSHILYDPAVIQSIEPLCGLCLRQSQLCQFYLAKGKGANGNLRINQKTSKGCLVKMNYSYGIAAESTTSSPCSNVPIHCPIFHEGSLQRKAQNIKSYQVRTPLEALQLRKIRNEEDMDKTGKGTSQTNKKVKSSAAGDIREPSCANS